MAQPRPSAFRALRNVNFRLWYAGALVSNVGVWMQRTAQDWLVLTVLTHRDAAAVGALVACQFGPQVLLLPWTGSAADRFDRRKLLIATQSVMGVLALGFAILTIGHWVQLWHVYGFALLQGVALAFDQPARQTFVGDLVGEVDLSNGVALNSTSLNLSRLIGPAMAGVLIAAVGLGWVFAIIAASFAAVLLSLAIMRADRLHRPKLEAPTPGGFVESLRHVRAQGDIAVLLSMLLIFGALGLNFPIFISTMSASVFHLGPGGFGLLMSVMACGSVAGALLSARRERPTIDVVVKGATVFGLAYALAAFMPNHILFAMALVVVGAATQTVTNSTSSLVQLAADPQMRGRVMALLVAVALGGQVLGAPLVGWVANAFGPRYAILVGAAAGLLAAAIGGTYLARKRRIA